MLRILIVGLFFTWNTIAQEASRPIPHQMIQNNFLRQLMVKNKNKTFFISPYSLSLSLSMLMNGANGETLNTLRSVFGLAKGETLVDFNKKNAEDLLHLSKQQNVEFEIASGVFFDQWFPVRADYLSKMRSWYGSENIRLPFQEASSVQKMNNWVDTKTRHKISHVVDEETIKESPLFIINTVYFKANWSESFPTENTRDRPFYSFSRESQLVPTMENTSRWPFVQTERYQALRLPYQGGRLVMEVILPTEGFYDSLWEDSRKGIFSHNFWSDLQSQYSFSKVHLQMPKMRLEGTYPLNEIFILLGLGTLFDRNADFSHMSKEPVALASSLQKTFLELDEFGSEAAAVTVLRMRPTSVMVPVPETIHEMILNRPFFIAVRDLETQALLFFGSIAEF